MNYENATILHNTDTNTDQINKKKKPAFVTLKFAH